MPTPHPAAVLASSTGAVLGTAFTGLLEEVALLALTLFVVLVAYWTALLFLAAFFEFLGRRRGGAR